MRGHEMGLKQAGYEDSAPGSYSDRAQGRDLVNMVINRRPLTSVAVKLPRRNLLH